MNNIWYRVQIFESEGLRESLEGEDEKGEEELE